MNTRRNLLLLGGVCGLTISVNAQNTKPNIIFMLVDDLGKEWIQQYGAENIELPNIQKLTDESIVFNRAYSMPQSTPSRIALLTGQYPYNNGWVNHYDVPRWANGAHFDAEKNPSYAVLLRDNGYKTCAAGKWQINDFRLEPDAMVKAGFSEYCMWTGTESQNVKLSDSRYWDPYIHTKSGSKQYKGQFGPDVYSDFVTDFIKENKDDPFFVYYAMTLTHTPFVHTPHKMDAKSTYEKHKAMVEYTDYIIGKIMKSVEENGVSDNTYLVLTTDNGTANSVVNVRNGQYIRGGKALLSENGINCPFIVHVPGQSQKRETNAVIDFTDLHPTFLELASVEKSKEYELDGKSFVSVLEGKDKKDEKNYALSMGCFPAWIGEDGMVKSQFDFKDRAIMGSKYKVYLSTKREIDRVYDIENDPYEANNLIADKKVMKKVDKEFGDIINSFPTKDTSPKYTPIANDESWNEVLKRNLRIKNNYGPTSTAKAYENFVNPPIK